MSEEQQPTSEKKNSVVKYILIVVIALFVVFAAVQPTPDAPEPQATTEPKQEEKPKEEKPVDNRDLDLTIRPNVFGLMISNNEPGSLKNCIVEINSGTFSSGYEAKVLVIGQKPRLSMYGEFTKDAERFDADKYAVESISIKQCESAPNRFGYYTTS